MTVDGYENSFYGNAPTTTLNVNTKEILMLRRNKRFYHFEYNAKRYRDESNFMLLNTQ